MSGVSGVMGVLGGSGGVGASTFAAALAAVADRSTLIDLDPVGGGIDVLLGLDDLPGARWSGLRTGGGRLDPDLLAAGLPRWNRAAVLAADVAPAADAVAEVAAAAAARGPVVLDLPRTPAPLRDAGLACCELCVLVAAATDVRSLTAAAAVLRSLPDLPVGLVLRRGGFGVAEAVELLGVPLLGVLPPIDRPAERVARRVAAGIVDGLVSGVAA